VRVEQAHPAIPATDRLSALTSSHQFDHPPAWSHLDGAREGEVQLVLPTSPADLNRWGFALHNCLGSYKQKVDSGQRLVLGVVVKGQLQGAVEVDPVRRRIVQATATKNRPLARVTRNTVAAMLLARGTIARA
jgi:hypothetical protein